MRRLIDSDHLTLVSRLLVGGMYIVASYYKIVEPSSFAKSIWQYHMVPGTLINLMAVILPWLELLMFALAALVFALQLWLSRSRRWMLGRA
jgi:hypothetical protein